MQVVMRNPSATLQVSLPKVVPARQLKSMLTVVETTYSTVEWIEQLKRSTESKSWLTYDEFVTIEESKMQVKRLEIGTPNLIELVGYLDGITATIQVIAALVGLPLVGTKAIKTYNEARLAKAQAEKVIAETEILRLRLDEGRELHRSLNMPDESLSHLDDTPSRIANDALETAELLSEQEFRTSMDDEYDDVD